MAEENGPGGGLDRIIKPAPVVLDHKDPEHQILLQSLIVGTTTLLDCQVQLSDGNPAWKVVPHVASEDPLAIASDKIIRYLSELIGGRPYGYINAEHAYLERSGFLAVPGGAIVIPRLQFYNWLPAPNVPYLVSVNPNLHQPMSIDLVVFEHPFKPRKFVFQAVERGKVRKLGDPEWAEYATPYDAGVYLFDARRISALRQLGLMPPKVIDFKS